ncbi:MAG TPA: hypothetical protein VEK79_24050 [Thermoanaerobaculia bacterium]|nr:hypothetical protein [Thermoanaerobaculia bacterium]
MPGLGASRVGWAGVLLLSAFGAGAAELLFRQPRHFTRRIDDPISGTARLIEEYCAGNQVVTISGDSVAIADYAKQELIEIDRAAGTYSITSFDAIARANAHHTSNDDVSVTVRVDPAIALSRSAVEVLIGAAYPNQRRKEHEVTLGRSRGVVTQSADYALPVEQTIEHDGVTITNKIVAISADRVPQQALLIPPGAKLVESRITRLARELRDLDRLPE